MLGLTLDTGALIALEARDRRLRAMLEQVREHGRPVTVPAAVLAEWWRQPNRSDLRRPGILSQERILQGFLVEPLTETLAKSAGAAAGQVGATAVDAIVMASAALRGDVVVTSDIEDLTRLQPIFREVRLLRATGA